MSSAQTFLVSLNYLQPTTLIDNAHPLSLITFLLTSRRFLHSSIIPQLFSNAQHHDLNNDDDDDNVEYEKGGTGLKQLSNLDLDQTFPKFDKLFGIFCAQASTLQFASHIILPSNICCDDGDNDRLLRALFTANLGCGRYWSRSLKHFQCKHITDDLMEVFIDALEGKIYNKKNRIIVDEKQDDENVAKTKTRAPIEFPIALEVLDISFSTSYFTDKGLEILCSRLGPKSRLRSLSLQSCIGLSRGFFRSSNEFLLGLAHSLRHLSLAKCDNFFLEDDHEEAGTVFSQLMQFSQLTSLDISNNRRISAFWKYVMQMTPPLKILNASGTNIGDMWWDDDVQFDKESERKNRVDRQKKTSNGQDNDGNEQLLTTSSYPVRLPFLNPEEHTMHTLNLSNCRYLDFFHFLGTLRHSITSIDLSFTNATIPGPLKEITHLRIFKAARSRLFHVLGATIEDLIHPHALAHTLEYVDLHENSELDKSAIVALKNARRLKFLDISYCDKHIGNATMEKVVSSIASLERLNIEGNEKIGNAGMSCLCRLQNLKRLDCKFLGSEMTHASVELITKAIPGLQVINHGLDSNVGMFGNFGL